MEERGARVGWPTLRLSAACRQHLAHAVRSVVRFDPRPQKPYDVDPVPPHLSEGGACGAGDEAIAREGLGQADPSPPPRFHPVKDADRRMLWSSRSLPACAWLTHHGLGQSAELHVVGGEDRLPGSPG